MTAQKNNPQALLRSTCGGIN